jgi:TolB-like protein
MKLNKFIYFAFLAQLAGALMFSRTNAGAAESSPMRLAVVPFSAPPGNGDIQQIAASAPDLLMAELSHDKRFQLVEREKVNAIWRELHLAESGFVSADTVGKLGKILACDWLVSGSFVPAGTNVQAWVKVIEVQSGVVLDLQAFPYSPTNVSATISAISTFLAQVNAKSQPRQYITLGKFVDLSISSAREDWAQRLRILIEKHYLAAGYGVVERETISPIFEEYQLQKAGLTGDATNRVKLKPAFWIVEAGCKWLYDANDEISVALRVQKVGGGEEVFRLTKPPGEELEKAVLASIQSALLNTAQMTMEQAQAAEASNRAARAMELANGRDELRVPGRSNLRQDSLNVFKQAVLLNTNDMRSKFMLGMGLFTGVDPVESQHGRELLEEVATSGDVPNAAKAKNLLEDFRTGRLVLKRLPSELGGGVSMVSQGQPISMPPSALSAQAISNLITQAAKMNEITNAAARAESVVQITSPPAIGHLNGGITAFTVGKGKILVACGTILKSFNFAGFFGPDSGTDFEDVELPLKIDHAITAMANNDSDLWLGTAGGGLMRIPKSGAPPRIFNEKDGFPMSSIKSLLLMQGRLLIGFGNGGNGAFGYLDIQTERFTGLMSEVTAFKSSEELLRPPPHSPVVQIKSEDGNKIWVASDLALYRLQLDSQQWSLALPMPEPLSRWGLGLRTVSVIGGHIAIIMPSHGFSFCKVSENKWSNFNLSTNLDENTAFTLAIDDYEKSHLWIGSHGKITIFDMDSQKIVGECKLVMPRTIQLFLCLQDDIFFIGDGQFSQTYCLYHMRRPKI